MTATRSHLQPQPAQPCAPLIEADVAAGARIAMVVSTCRAYEDCLRCCVAQLQALGQDREVDIHVISDLVIQDLPDSFRQIATGDRSGWSKVLGNALAKLSSYDYIVYIQEDYILRRVLRRADLLRAAAALTALPNAVAAHLTHFGPLGRPYPVEGSAARRYPRFSRFAASLQAAVWKRQALQDLLREHETPWQFEAFGTLRMWKSGLHAIEWLPQGCSQAEPLYYATAIVRGGWDRQVLSALSREGIQIDRGNRRDSFDPGPLRRRLKLLRDLCRNPHLMRSLR